MLFDEIEGLPEQLLQVESRDIEQICPRPTLIHLPGEQQPALFVSLLLHGNEDAGLLALQELFRQVDHHRLPRALTLFVGNVEACRMGVRFGDHQIDFNRAWPGSELPPGETHQMLADVRQRVLQRGVFASVDVHNNTGRNPHYGCICSLAAQHIQLASLFSDRIVYFTRPKGIQTQAFMEHCPSVTVECGQIGDLQGAHAAASFLWKCLKTNDFSTHESGRQAEVFHTVARIKFRDGCTVGFSQGNDVVLREDIDLLNFRSLAPGEKIGKLNAQLEECFVVHDQQGKDVTSEFLSKEEETIVFERDVMPSMLTKDLAVMRQDCLGYLMETVPEHHIP